MSKFLRLILVLAGLAGAAGVAMGAAATHMGGGGMAATGAQFLILHAAGASAAVALATGRANSARIVTALAAAGMLAGAALFSGDLAMRAFAGGKLLWGTAPFGGTTMIIAWLMLAASALLPARRA